VTVQVRDNGAARLVRTVGSGAGSVDVGALGPRAMAVHGDSGVTVAQVLEWAEFGIGQPMRSWLRDWIEQSQAEILAVQRREYARVLSGAQSKDQALARIGVWIVGQIQARIAAGIPPANAESTIARKGSSTPLIDTGQARSSIASRVNR
jgi:hypothetical protein